MGETIGERVSPDIRLDTALWLGSKLAVIAEGQREDGEEKAWSWTLELVGEEGVLASAEFSSVPAPDSVLHLTCLDAGVLLSSAESTARIDAAFRIVGARDNDRVVLPLGKGCEERALLGFCEGSAHADGAVMVAHADDDGSLCVSVVGHEAGPCEWPGAAASPAFGNRLLVRAARKGGAVLAAAFDALHDGSLATRVDVRNDGRVGCTCSFGGASVYVDLTGLAIADEATLLDEGRGIESLDPLAEHKAQFSVLYDMLVELDEFCQLHGITYYLAGGTLLGAVRHRGFIPWDHDIDIYMPDGDFQKLRELFNAGEGIPGRKIDSAFDDPLYPERLGRYVNCETTRFNPKKPRGLGGIGEAGMFIDIFILAPLAGDTREERQGHLFDFIAYEEVRNRFDRKHAYRPRQLLERLSDALEVWNRDGHEKALDFMEGRLAAFRDEESSVFAACSAGTLSPYGRMLDAIWFEGDVRVPLLDHDFSIPSGSRDFLQEVYGLSWRVYPAKRSVPRDRSLYNSVKVPSRFVVQDGLRSVSEQRCLDVKSRHKKNLLEDLVRRAPVDDARDKLAKFWCARNVSKALAESGIDLRNAVENHRWDLVDPLLGDFYEFHSVAGFGRLRRHVELDGIVFKAAVLNLVCNRNDLNFACKVVRARRLEGGPLDADEKLAADVVDGVCLLRELAETERLDEARDLALELQLMAPGIEFVELMSIALDYAQSAAGSDDGAECMAAALERALEGFEKHGGPYWLFLVAEGLLASGSEGAAVAAYGKVAQESLDGIVLNEVSARLDGVR